MSKKVVPFSLEEIEKVIEKHPTPFHIYDGGAIRENARRFYKAFDWVPGGFKNYFAVKALPNPYIVKILMEEGMGADCSSLAELKIADAVGMTKEDIMFTSNDTPLSEFREARRMDAIINLDDITHLDFISENIEMPKVICFRYNPGELKSGNDLIGNPTEAKYGFTKEQIIEGYKRAKSLGVERFGLHTMVASNELNADYFIDTAKLLFNLVKEVKEQAGVDIEFVNLGGGIGIPYEPEDEAVDLEYVSAGIKREYEDIIVKNGLGDVRIVMECGRMVTGPYGYLVTKVLHKKDTYKKFVGLDSCMANLMRPALYGAYHHITVLGKDGEKFDYKCDVTGSLCENNDKFAVDRVLPEPSVGDILVIHDTGAHGHAMGFNYNGKLRSAEILLKSDKSFMEIRRAETVKDYFATLDFSRLNSI